MIQNNGVTYGEGGKKIKSLYHVVGTGCLILLILLASNGCIEPQSATVLQQEQIPQLQKELDGVWSVTCVEPDGNTVSWRMRFRLEGTALTHCIYNPDKHTWSGYTFLGTRYTTAYTYEMTGQLLINETTDGECQCTANVTTEKEWIFTNNQLIGRIIETTIRILGTPETCPSWVFEQLPRTKTTIWTGFREPDSYLKD